jgi:hypothetical protein
MQDRDHIPDAGCCTGQDVEHRTGASQAALERGFVKVPEPSDEPKWFPTMEGGVVGRPRGWER